MILKGQHEVEIVGKRDTNLIVDVDDVVIAILDNNNVLLINIPNVVYIKTFDY